LVSILLMKNIILKSVGAFVNITAILFPKWNRENAFKILSKVQRAKISEKGIAFLNSANQEYITENGTSSVLYKWGNGANKVLFLHGWMSNSQRWMPYIEKLDLNTHTVYALDAPGHGLSKTKYLNLELFRQALVATLKKTGPIDTLICHSFSNTALTYTYLNNRDLTIDKFIIMGAPSGMDAIFTYFKETLGLSKTAIKSLDEKINQILKVPHQEILVSNLIRQAKQKMLVIHDEGDKITPFAPIKAALKEQKTIETLITKGLKHDLKGDTIYDRVIAFINE